MDLNSAIDIIIKDLNQAREIIDDLKKYPGVPALQVELAKSKCKSASEVIALFKDICHDAPVAASERKAVIPQTEAKQPEQKLSEPKQPEQKQSEQKRPEAADLMPPVGKKEEGPQPVRPHLVAERPVRQAKEPSIFPESAILADQFSNRASFNEELGGKKHDDDISEILKTQPISNLADAIGINDKFLFMREIFKGNIDLYNKTIAELDSVATLQDATRILSSCTGERGENDAARQLLLLVKRKFTSE